MWLLFVDFPSSFGFPGLLFPTAYAYISTHRAISLARISSFRVMKNSTRLVLPLASSLKKEGSLKDGLLCCIHQKWSGL